MKRVLLTGMSGTGKSTMIQELIRRGYKAIDTDYGGWSHWMDTRTGRPASSPAADEAGWGDRDWVWREDRIRRLLATEDTDILVVAGTSPNQGKFYSQFDAIILLSAPVDTLVERLSARVNNPYGTTPRSLARVLEDLETVEPLLRRGADHEIDTSAPPDQVVAEILDIVRTLA